MTRERAIDIIKCLAWHTRPNEEDVEQAIKALEREQCEDAVSRKAVLDNAYAYGNGLEPEGYCVNVEDIQSLPPVTPTQNWIPVKERLPEESLNSVIGWDACRERCVFVQYIDGHFQITGRNESFDIIAWMPLPDDYKAEKESKE